MSYLYLISFSIFTAKAQRAQRKDTFLLPLERTAKEKNNRYALFLGFK
jgi:hypothetical protein